MKSITEIASRHYSNVEKLKWNYKKELSSLNDYKDQVKAERLKAIKEQYINKLRAMQTDRENQLQKLYKEESIKLDSVTTLNSITSNEMAYITTILNGENANQIKKLSNKYINNVDVKEMIKASINKLDSFSNKSIQDTLSAHTSKFEELESTIKSLSTQNITEEFGIFNRIV